MLVRTVVYAIGIVISFLLQTSVFSFLKLADTVPNVMLAFVVCISMMRGSKEGMSVGFFCGLLIDIFYGTGLGKYALLYVIIGYINGYFYRLYYQYDIVLPLLVLFVNSLIYDLAIYVFFFLIRKRLGFLSLLKSIMIPEILYTAIIAIAVYWLLSLILSKLDEYEERRIL